MRLRWVAPCERLQDRADGLTDVVGLFEFWQASAFPVSLDFALAFCVEGEPNEAGWLMLSVTDGSGVSNKLGGAVIRMGDQQILRYGGLPLSAFSVTEPDTLTFHIQFAEQVPHVIVLPVRCRQANDGP